MYYNVKEGHEAEFESIFSKVAKKLKSSGVVKGAQLYKAVGKNEYLIYTEWESIDAFKAFVQSRDFGETVNEGREIIEGRPRHRVFSEVNES